MADNLSVPNAPLSHPNSIEHRRLIAARANQDVTEQGVFTPAFDFATTGDLSNGAVTANGDFWRIGPLVHFSIDLNVTPTFTTASGQVRVTGLPYASASGVGFSFVAVRLGGTGITWPSSDVVGLITGGDQFLTITFQGTASAGVTLAASDITSAVALIVRATGFYPI